MANCNKIKKFMETWQKFREWIQNFIGTGILFESVLLFIINYYYLIPQYDVIKHIRDILNNKIISPISATDIIAILTSLLLAMGFIYYIGFITALRIKQPFARYGYAFRDAMLFNGGILFLAFFLSLLIVFLSKSGMSDIIPYIAINTLLMLGFGFGNEMLIQRNNGRATLTMNPNDPTPISETKKPIENLELLQTTNVDYRFRDSDRNEYIIPIGQVRQIRYDNVNRPKNLLIRLIEWVCIFLP